MSSLKFIFYFSVFTFHQTSWNGKDYKYGTSAKLNIMKRTNRFKGLCFWQHTLLSQLNDEYRNYWNMKVLCFITLRDVWRIMTTAAPSYRFSFKFSWKLVTKLIKMKENSIFKAVICQISFMKWSKIKLIIYFRNASHKHFSYFWFIHLITSLCSVFGDCQPLSNALNM